MSFKLNSFNLNSQCFSTHFIFNIDHCKILKMEPVNSWNFLLGTISHFSFLFYFKCVQGSGLKAGHVVANELIIDKLKSMVLVENVHTHANNQSQEN